MITTFNRRYLAANKLFSHWKSSKSKIIKRSFCLALLSCSWLTSVLVLPATSAERISFTYGAFGEFYISIDDLETFARTGKITSSFAYYADRFSPQDLVKLRDLLNRSFDVSVVTTSIFLNLPIGKQLTKEIGSIIDSPLEVSQPALRASLILAAAEPDGLTILNVLRLYSTKTLRLNSRQIFKAVDEATKLLTQTERVFQALEQEAKSQIEIVNSARLKALKDISQPEKHQWRKEYISIDLKRGKAAPRKIEGVVYLPLSKDRPVPLVAIAPGLNTDWHNFTYIAEHLASHGFGVAALNFPSTNAKRINAVLNGLDTPPSDNEWVEQPKVVTQLLDEIERKSKNDPAWQGKLDLQRVGIVGQSLGGYTAMAIAGAKVDWQHLQQKCQESNSLEQIDLNPSLLWQCQSSHAVAPKTDLQDKRVVAAIAINPVTNPIFSKSGINKLESPLMIITGEKDRFAPALDEQIKPFTELSKIEKYLVLIGDSTHFSFIGVGNSQDIKLPPEIIGFDPAIARSYLKTLSVAFFQTHLTQQNQFRSYLTESYLKTISKQQSSINLLRFLTEEKLEELIED